MTTADIKPKIAGRAALAHLQETRGHLLAVLEDHGVHVDPSLEVTLDAILGEAVQAGQDSTRDHAGRIHQGADAGLARIKPGQSAKRTPGRNQGRGVEMTTQNAFLVPLEGDVPVDIICALNIATGVVLGDTVDEWPVGLAGAWNDAAERGAFEGGRIIGDLARSFLSDRMAHLSRRAGS